MYRSYTLIDNSKFDYLYKLFFDFIAKIENNNIKSKGIPISSYYFDEKYWDIISLLKNIDIENYMDIENDRNIIIEYITKELIIFYKLSPMFRWNMEKYSGISISGQMNNRYNVLEFYLLLKKIRELNN
jgi:hypothetical protein